MTDIARVRTALEAIGSVSDGASEECVFLEVTNQQTGVFMTIDARSTSALVDADFNKFMEAVASHIGVA